MCIAWPICFGYTAYVGASLLRKDRSAPRPSCRRYALCPCCKMRASIRNRQIPYFLYKVLSYLPIVFLLPQFTLSISHFFRQTQFLKPFRTHCLSYLSNLSFYLRSQLTSRQLYEIVRSKRHQARNPSRCVTTLTPKALATIYSSPRAAPSASNQGLAALAITEAGAKPHHLRST